MRGGSWEGKSYEKWVGDSTDGLENDLKSYELCVIVVIDQKLIGIVDNFITFVDLY